MMKLHEPDKCPFCGSALTGGGDRTAYYACGAHVWIEPHGSEYECTLKGHQGLCKEVVSGETDPELARECADDTKAPSCIECGSKHQCPHSGDPFDEKEE